MNADEIEYMNAHGPYDHGIWTAALGSGGTTATFGSSSLFATRAEVMSKKIIDFLKATYSSDELKNLRILDVGCYDGWILEKIAAVIEFARSVGVEPRQKNIDKGAFARRACHVEGKCEFVRGGYKDLDDLFPGEMFDIVLCLGMLHHVNSVETAVRAVSSKCAKLLIVDSMIIPALKADFDEIAAVINPVDIIYRKKEKTWGLAAYKLESPYFDGSTSDAELVNIPQESLIRMCLQVSSFSNIQVMMTEQDFYPKEFQKLRGVNEVMLASFREVSPNGQKSSWKSDALEYERLFCLNPVSSTFLLYLFENYNSTGLAKYFIEAFDGSPPPKDASQSKQMLTDEEKEIASTISRAPFEKVLLELAKYWIGKGQMDSARTILCEITTTRNADWRSFYRACYLLWKIETQSRDLARVKHYTKLLSISNPLFPLEEM